MALVRRSTSCTMQPLPDNLSRRQLDNYFQGVFVADLRSVFALVNNLQKQITELQLNKSNTIVPPSPSTPSTILLTPSPAPGPPISSCTPAAAAAADVLAPNSASASSRSNPPLIRLDARYLGSPAVHAHEHSAQGGSLDFAASTARPPQLQAPASDGGSRRQQRGRGQRRQQPTAAADEELTCVRLVRPSRLHTQRPFLRLRLRRLLRMVMCCENLLR